MNPSWPDPDSWIDIVDHFLVALFMLMIAVVPTWITVRSSRGIKDIKNQVVNGHTSPLRSDLDKAIAAIELLGKELLQFKNAISEDIGHLRKQLSDEEDRRRTNVAELRDDIDRKFHNTSDKK